MSMKKFFKNKFTYILNPDYNYILKTIEYLNKNLRKNAFPLLRTNKEFCKQDALKWFEEQNCKNQTRSICINEQDEVIGAAYLNRSRGRQSHNATLAVTVCPQYQGYGIGTNLCNLLIDIALERGIKRIEDFPIKTNIPAIKMLNTLGFKQEGVMRKKACLDDGSLVDCLYMVLFLD